ncbi:hypothetical protein HK100_000978 [Physocladia obscura]|uniref:Uncharacterized protein n=1 Tax=Physocladia obscura TaxID=109957 RepID=A0AAD5XEU7_9FUNG|nr:hypothetical protein HK100_000978 [Physocladia obscura]
MSDDGEEEIKEEEPSLGIYEGERNESKQRHGKGKNIFVNGDVYDGQYQFGAKSGYGSYKWKKGGARYIGEYKNDLRHGEGYFIYPDGSKYRGNFVEGKRTGYGSYLYANGDLYQGEWQNDVKHGKGVYLYKNGSKKAGTFVNGVLQGSGEIMQPDHKVQGNWAGNISMDIPAKLTFSSGFSKEITDPQFFTGIPSIAQT